MSDLSDQIEVNAAGPKKVQIGASSVEQHPLKDQIEADRYVRGSNAAANRYTMGLRLGKVVPPGAV